MACHPFVATPRDLASIDGARPGGSEGSQLGDKVGGRSA